MREPSFSLNEIKEKASRYFSKSHLTKAKGKYVILSDRFAFSRISLP